MRLEFRGRYDLDAALDPVTEKPIGAVVVERLTPRGVLDAFDRLENGAKRRTDEALRQNTRSAAASIRSRRSGSRLSRVVKSTEAPRRRLQELLDADQLDK